MQKNRKETNNKKGSGKELKTMPKPTDRLKEKELNKKLRKDKPGKKVDKKSHNLMKQGEQALNEAGA